MDISECWQRCAIQECWCIVDESVNGCNLLYCIYTTSQSSGVIVLSVWGKYRKLQFSFCSVMSDSLWPHEPQHARPPCPSPTPGVCSNSTSIESVMPPSHLILCCLLLLLPSIFPSIRVFVKESALRMRWPNYWSFSFSISPSSEHPGLIFVRMDWLDLLAAPPYMFFCRSLYIILSQILSVHTFRNTSECLKFCFNCLT